jgi:hypothetical protein
MMSWGAARLYRQNSTCCDRSKFKAQILDSALGRVSGEEILSHLQRYLSIIGFKIESFNGLEVDRRPEEFSKQTFATHMETYLDRKKDTCKVHRHSIELGRLKWQKGQAAQAKLYMFVCKNGSRMMQTMLLYK